MKPSNDQEFVVQGMLWPAISILLPGVVILLALLFGDARLVHASEIPDNIAVRAIIGEAANQGFDGMTAVAEGIRNRGTLKGVYGLKAKHVDKQPEWVWVKARQAWERSKTSDLVHRADHWENTTAFGVPYWAKSMVKTAQIKDHAFYRR